MTVMFGINALGRHKYHHARDEHSKELCRNIYIASQSQNLGDEENFNVYNNDQNQDLWRPTIQLHTPLLEICHHALPRRTNRPLRKLLRERRIPCFVPNQ
jgi:hypothetical protein